MKKLITICLVLVFVCIAQAAMDVDIPTNPGVGNTGFSATLDGPDGAGAWNFNIAPGGNYIEQYLFFDADDGGAYEQPDITFSDVLGLSMHTKAADNTDNDLPYVQIYTKMTGTDDVGTWYHQIYTAAIQNTADDTWELWNADGFYEGKHYTDTGADFLTLSELAAGVSEEILAIKFQLGDTGAGFALAGAVSEPTVNYSTGTLGTVNYHLVPEPATMVLLGLGGLLIRRKK